MKRKGFILAEVVIGIFLIGLAAICFIPILTNNYKTFSLIKLQVEMDYLGEYVVERVYSQDEYTRSLLTTIENEVEFRDLEKEYLERYKCSIINMGTEEYLWNFKIIIELREEKGESPYVELAATIPKK